MSESPSSALRVHSEDGHGGGHGADGLDASGRVKTLNRTSRACNNCRKQKMRCIGAEDPPCKRCRTGGLDCLFEKPAREGTQVGEERIRMLESQVGSIQSTLAELVCTLKAANTANGIGNGTGTGGGGGENGGPSSSSAASSARSRHHQPQQQQQQREEYASPTIYNSAADPLPNMAQYEGSLISIISPAASGGADHHLHQHAGSSTAAAESSLPSAYRSYPYGSNGGGGPSSSSTAAGVYSHPHHGGSTRTVPLSIPDNHPYPLPPPIPTSRHGPRSSSHAGVGGSSSSSSALPGGVLGGRQLPTNPSSASGSVYANLLSQALYPHRQKHHVGPATSSARTTPAGSEADEDELLHREELEFPTRSALEPLGAMGRLAQAALLEQDGPAASGAAGAGSLMGGQQAAGEGPGEPSSSTTAGGRSSLGGKKEPGSGTGKGGLDGLLLLAEGAKHSPKADESGSAGPSTAANSPSASGPLAESSTAGGAGTSAAAALEGESRRPGKRARFAENDDEANGRGGSRLSSSSGGRHTIGVDGGRRPLSAGTGLRESHILGGPGMAGGDGGPPIGKDGRILDCIDAGIVDLEEGRELFDIYWKGAFRFLPIYEPGRDNFEERSPFSVGAMCFVGARIRDGGGPKSEAQIGLWYHVRRISQETLFKTTTRVEAIQATILVTGWNEYGWLLGGHAVRLAFELGCHTAFLRLARSGMGAGRTPKQIEEDRPLVIMARVWFCLYVIEHQMSYGTGRPPIVREDETIVRCREFLNHPLAIETDLRLIASVEIMSIRAPLHLQMYNLPEEEVVGPETLARLHQANLDFESWYKDWDTIFEARFGEENDIFFRQSLRIQKAYAQLFHNCTALREVRGPADVRQMVPEQRELAKMALRNAQECLDICLHAESYRWAFTYAVHYTHVCAAFAATLLIRLARIFPTELDLRQTARDVTELAKILSNVPAGRYARSIRLTLRSARRRKVMPPPSLPPSPSSRPSALPPGQAAPFSPSSYINPASGLTQATPVASRTTSPNVPMTSLPEPPALTAAGAGTGLTADGAVAEDESPVADFSMDFDWGYTADLLDKVGLSVPEGGDVPLWLHGSDIGSSQLPSSGMENFFLPSDLDFRLYTADDLSAGGSGAIPPSGGGGFAFASEGDGSIW